MEPGDFSAVGTSTNIGMMVGPVRNPLVKMSNHDSLIFLMRFWSVVMISAENQTVRKLPGC